MVLRPGLSKAILAGESPKQAMKLGWAQGALLTTFPSDTTMATLDQVRAFAQGGTARVQRCAKIKQSRSNPEVRK